VTRHPARVTIKTGVMKDGKLVARQCLIYMETGAYADAGPRVTQKAATAVWAVPFATYEDRRLHGLHQHRCPRVATAASARCK